MFIKGIYRSGSDIYRTLRAKGKLLAYLLTSSGTEWERKKI